MKTVEHKTEKYLAQNNGRSLTIPQKRQLRKTQTRIDGQNSHEILRERQRNMRQRFRDWMAGVK
jgi:hypothetical protein